MHFVPFGIEPHFNRLRVEEPGALIEDNEEQEHNESLQRSGDAKEVDENVLHSRYLRHESEQPSQTQHGEKQQGQPPLEQNLVIDDVSGFSFFVKHVVHDENEYNQVYCYDNHDGQPNS